MEACHYYEEIPRVHLFGRFLGLYNQFENEEINTYVNTINNIKYEDNPNESGCLTNFEAAINMFYNF